MGIWIYRFVAWLLLTTHDTRTNADEAVVNQLVARIEALEKRCEKQEELIKQLNATIETQAVEIQQLRFEDETIERNETVTIHRLNNETTSPHSFADEEIKGETQEELIKQLNATVFTQAAQIKQLREFEVETRKKHELIDKLDNETTSLRVFANDISKVSLTKSSVTTSMPKWQVIPPTKKTLYPVFLSGVNTNKTTIAFHATEGYLRKTKQLCSTMGT